jgi:hypothetical protein
MHIFLVSDSKTPVNFFPELSDFLKKKVAGLEVSEIFVPFPEDVPAAVSAVLGEADLVFVFVLYEEMDFKVQSLLNNLIELDMKDDTIIVKVVEEDDLPSFSQDGLAEEKQKLVDKWGQLILDRLFKPDSFKPKERPSGGLFSL